MIRHDPVRFFVVAVVVSRKICTPRREYLLPPRSCLRRHVHSSRERLENIKINEIALITRDELYYSRARSGNNNGPVILNAFHFSSSLVCLHFAYTFSRGYALLYRGGRASFGRLRLMLILCHCMRPVVSVTITFNIKP